MKLLNGYINCIHENFENNRMNENVESLRFDE
jgi:hypothetical protein